MIGIAPTALGLDFGTTNTVVALSGGGDPAPIGRMIALIEHEQGFPLYEAVGRTKRALSASDEAQFAFAGGGVEINATVSRREFELWIAEDLRRIEAAMDAALAKAKLEPAAIDRVFLTGGSSLTRLVSTRAASPSDLEDEA